MPLWIPKSAEPLIVRALQQIWEEQVSDQVYESRHPIPCSIRGSVGSNRVWSSRTALSPFKPAKWRQTYFISSNVHRPSTDSAKLPREQGVSHGTSLIKISGLVWRSILLGSSIRLMAPLTQAASRRTTNSNPSLETRVTYFLSSWPFVVILYAVQVVLIVLGWIFDARNESSRIPWWRKRCKHKLTGAEQPCWWLQSSLFFTSVYCWRPLKQTQEKKATKLGGTLLNNYLLLEGLHKIKTLEKACGSEFDYFFPVATCPSSRFN